MKVIHLGANLSMLEEKEKGELKALFKEASSWLDRWFREVSAWKPKDVNPKRTMLIRCFGIPCQAWSFIFFECLIPTIGTFICCDDNTSN